MRIKEGVILNGLNINMRQGLIAAENIWKKYGIEEGVTITGGLEGTHSAGSLHYYGYAVDLRTHYFSNEICNRVANELRSILPDDFDVVLEATHIHLEYDKKD